MDNLNKEERNVNPAPSHSYTIELRFYGDGLVPSDITELLRLEPSNSSEMLAVRAGGRKRRPFWAYNAQQEDGFKPDWEVLEEGLSFLLEHLCPLREKIVELSSDFEGVWWCGHFQTSFDGGPTLSPNILSEIASYGIPLSIDNYFSEE